MNPVVVLRRLTVTVGGFRIELLPGPCPPSSASFDPEAFRSMSLQQEVAPGAERNGLDPETPGTEQAMDFGPCVNPNDVQHEKRQKPTLKKSKLATPMTKNKPDMTHKAEKLLKSPDKKLSKAKPDISLTPSSQGPPKTPESPTKPRKPFSNSSPHPLKKPQSQMGDDDPEKGRVKKAEKILTKQRSRSSRSVSVEEPELFVPDNAPAPKKDPELPHEDAWDSSKQCGLCEKPHNNR